MFGFWRLCRNISDVFEGFFTFSTIMSFIMSIFIYVCLWFIFKKMGHQGWKGIIPGYNLWVRFEDTYGSGAKCFMTLIPFYGIYVAIRFNIDWAHDFNRTTGYGWGLAFLAPIFYGMLAFRKDIEYKDGTYAYVDPVQVTNANTVSAVNTSVIAEELRQLKSLHDEGVLTDEEYEAKRKELVDKL